MDIPVERRKTDLQAKEILALIKGLRERIQALESAPASSSVEIERIRKRIDELEDNISQIREKLAGIEQKTNSSGALIEQLGQQIVALRASIDAGFHAVQSGILQAFSRLSFAMLGVLLIAFIAIASVVGSSIYLEGGGFKAGSRPTEKDNGELARPEYP